MKKMFFVLLLIFSTLNAENLKKSVFKLKKYDSLFRKYSLQYNVPKKILVSLALTENRKADPKAKRYNKNGTIDRGLMQINSLWIKELPELKLTAKKLQNPSVSIKVAAYILSKHIKRKGQNWKAYGSYHSKTPSKRDKYIKRLQKSYFAVVVFY